jgi:hypothetical protein
MHTNTSSGTVISLRVLNANMHTENIKKKHRKILKYAVGMPNSQNHKKITEYSGNPIGSSELLGHTLDIYQIQHLLETEQTVGLLA